MHVVAADACRGILPASWFLQSVLRHAQLQERSRNLIQRDCKLNSRLEMRTPLLEARTKVVAIIRCAGRFGIRAWTCQAQNARLQHEVREGVSYGSPNEGGSKCWMLRGGLVCILGHVKCRMREVREGVVPASTESVIASLH